MPGKIFINYRRDDAPGDARGVRDALAQRFGRANVFMDVDNLLIGQRFDQELAKALDDCDLLIAIVGPRWMELLRTRAGSGERDFVREEIAAALQRNIMVIPVLVGREGSMPAVPSPHELPADIRDLVLYQKHNVAHERFGRDTADLVEGIVALRRTIAPRARAVASAAPWGWIGASVLATVVAGYVGAFYSGVPVPWPTLSQDRAGVVAVEEKAALAEQERRRTAEELARQKAAERQRSIDEAAARKAVEERQVAAAQEAARKSEAARRPEPSTATIKVGILHSLSGTMAISETTLKDVMLMLIDEQNKKGGVLGRKLEAVIVDPASNWPLFSEKARELITQQKVSVVFGCWTSVSRKSVLPVFKELNSILFYPAPYEGEESERNVFYTGATPNQQAIPAVDYLMSKDGGEVKRWVLAGTDYIYPRTTNRIIEAYLKSKGVAAQDIMINYTPFGHSDWQTIVADIKKFGSAGKKTAVVSTISGDANVPFYKELANAGVKATHIPVVALSLGEEELAGIDTKPLIGHLAAGNYFQSVKDRNNQEFVAKWKAFTKNPKRVTSDTIEAHVIGFNMWVKAVEKAGSVDTNKVIDSIVGIEVPNLTGGISKMLPNHHITKPVMIGEIRPDGQFDVVWRTRGLVPGDAWSDFLEGSKDLEADWVSKKCGNFNIKTGKCGA